LQLSIIQHSGCLLGLVNWPAIQETIMIENFYPNPIVVQRLQAGPLSTHIDSFVQQLFDEGYALWTAKYAIRLLADLTSWMQQQGLTTTDLAEPPVNTFFQHRYQIRRPHRDDRAILKKLLAYLRSVGVIAAPVKAVAVPAYASIAQAFQQYLIYQRNLAPSTIRYYLNTVVCFLNQCFGAQPPTLDAMCAQDVIGFMLQQARRYSSAYQLQHGGACRRYQCISAPTMLNTCCIALIRKRRKVFVIMRFCNYWPGWVCGPLKWRPSA
jgi:hypothetical protein